MPPWLRLYALGWVPASLLVALSPGDALATQAVALGPRACAGLEQRAFENGSWKEMKAREH